MTDATTETLHVDGVSLSTYAWNVTVRGSRWHVAAVRGGNVTVPGRHGTLYVPDKKFDENELTLNMWAVGANSDGTVPTGTSQRQQVRNNLDALMLVFTQRSKLMRLSQILPDGTTREAYAECVEAIDFSTVAGATRAEFSVALKLPDPFWQDTADQTFLSGTGVTAGQQFSLDQFEGATAPMDELILVVSGPITNPKITVLDTGATVQLSQTVASGDDWRINAATWESVTGTGIAFDGVGTNAIADTTYSGSARLLSLLPSRATGQKMIELDGSSLGAGTQVRVRGRRKYMFG